MQSPWWACQKSVTAAGLFVTSVSGIGIPSRLAVTSWNGFRDATISANGSLTNGTASDLVTPLTKASHSVEQYLRTRGSLTAGSISNPSARRHQTLRKSSSGKSPASVCSCAVLPAAPTRKSMAVSLGSVARSQITAGTAKSRSSTAATARA